MSDAQVSAGNRHAPWNVRRAGSSRNWRRIPHLIARQRLLYRVPWDAEATHDRLEQFVLEQFGDPDGIGVLDETGNSKKGTRSVRVAKQYCGAAGKLENCQVATLLTYTNAHGHVFLDRQLYLPETWSQHPERRKRAHVPAAVRFQTKPQKARAMLEHAWELGACQCAG